MQTLICFLCTIISVHYGVFSQECALNVSHELIHNYCAGKNSADLTVRVDGGFPPYKYLWNTGAQTHSIKLTDDGIFQVEIIDKKGCKTEFSTKYQPVSALKINDIKRDGESNDRNQLIADVSGGVPPYDYYWFGPVKENVNTKVLINALPGDYLLLVKDSQNCVLSRSYQIEDKKD